MKRFILGGLSVLLLSAAVVPAAQAEMAPATPPANADTIGMAVTPFNLVFLAYHGFFEDEGISKYNTLISDYQVGRVTAQNLIQVGITMRRLAPDTLMNRAYVNSVERQLQSLSTMDN
jgi:hypothetical protein